MKTPLSHIPRHRRGFSLVELLTVIVIVAILSVLATPAVVSINRAGSIKRAGADLSSILEQARSHAMAYNTYTWVGLSPQSDNSVIVGVVAARNGLSSPQKTDTTLNDADVVPLGRLSYLKDVALKVPPTSTSRPSVDAQAQVASLPTAIVPFAIARGNSKITFDKYVVQFNNRGEARIAPNSLRPLIEIGLASPLIQTDDNYAAVQIGGLSGSVASYQP